MLTNKKAKEWLNRLGRTPTVREILSAAPKWIVFTFFRLNSDPRPWLNMGLWYDVNREEMNARILWRLPKDIIGRIIKFMFPVKKRIVHATSHACAPRLDHMINWHHIGSGKTMTGRLLTGLLYELGYEHIYLLTTRGQS